MVSVQVHQKKITGLYMKEKTAVLSVSDDGHFRITSMCPEFDNKLIDPQEFELTCFALRAPTFNPSAIEIFFGSALGKMFYYSCGFLAVDKQIIYEDRKEGPITNVVCHQDIVAWSTPSKIRVIHYSKK